MLYYFSIPVELRITYLLVICRTIGSARKSHVDNKPILPTLTAVVPFVVSHGSCKHLLARSGSVVSYLQTTYNELREHWDATSTQTPCNIHIVHSTLIPKSKILNSIKMAIFSRRLAPRLARWVKQERLYLCHLCNRYFSHLCYK